MRSMLQYDGEVEYHKDDAEEYTTSNEKLKFVLWSKFNQKL